MPRSPYGTRQLAERLIDLDVVTPAGVLAATPQVTSWALGDVILERLLIRIPRGHNGNTGIVLLYDGTPILPANPAPTFIVANDDHIETTPGLNVSHPITVQTYNIGLFRHTHYLRAVVTDINAEQKPGPASGVPVLVLT